MKLTLVTVSKLKPKKFPIDPKTFFIQEITNDRIIAVYLTEHADDYYGQLHR